MIGSHLKLELGLYRDRRDAEEQARIDRAMNEKNPNCTYTLTHIYLADPPSYVKIARQQVKE